MKTIQKTRLLAVKGEQLLVIEKKDAIKRFTLAGGVKKRNESLEESLVRETQEEIGLYLNAKTLAHVISKVKLKQNITTIKHHFVTTIKTNVFKVVETEKFKAVYWCYWEDALPYLDKEDKNAVKKYFKSKFKKKVKSKNYESSIPPRIAM
ncbi:NUDIX hydrolase [Kordia jejudonensis]|uniref:NUDIX hydrolase n=1 Tax=Kordia jejudonensis TaxID=1348245 RepID=UPI0006296593|nr:NUDIX hydrolase [Kordia jejudonensis]